MKTRKMPLICLLFLILLLSLPCTVMAAGQKSVYVLTSVSSEYSATELAYNKNGLLKKATIPSTSFGWPAKKLTASYTAKGALKKVSIDDYTRKYTIALSYKSGKISKRKMTTKYSSGDKETETTTFKWEGKTFTAATKDADGDVTKTDTGKLNAKNQIVSRTTKYEGDSSATEYSFKYDAKGFMKSVVSMYGKTTTKMTIKNTVKNGRLVKRKVVKGSSSYTFKYKKIKVPASYAKIVKAQQRYLVNNMDYVLLETYWERFEYPIW